MRLQPLTASLRTSHCSLWAVRPGEVSARITGHLRFILSAARRRRANRQAGCIIRPMMRWVLIVLGVVLGLVLLWFGVIWTLQGLNLWRGSFMSGSPRWLTIGVILDVAAILLLVQAGLLLRRQVKG